MNGPRDREETYTHMHGIMTNSLASSKMLINEIIDMV